MSLISGSSGHFARAARAWKGARLESATVRSVSGTACSVRYGQRRIELTLAPGQTKNITAREPKEL